MASNYEILIKKLDLFIRKYYRNLIIKGVLISLVLFLFLWLTTSSIEFFGRFSTLTRSIIFYITITLLFVTFVKFIFFPVLQFFRIGKIISHKQAAAIISNHFKEISDKLLNTLELSDIKEDNKYSKELIMASIDQRIDNLQSFDFSKAVNVRFNYKLLKYLAATAFIVVLVYVLYPAVLTEGSKRIIKHNVYFEKPAPYKFVLMNDSLNVEKGADFKLSVETKGDYAPNNVFVKFGGNNYLMKKEEKNLYSYEFKNVNNNINFTLHSEEVESDKYLINVLPTPILLDFIIDVSVPEYTGEKDMIVKNTGDITVPQGSKIKWEFNSFNVDTLIMKYDNKLIKGSKNQDKHIIEKQVYNTNGYSLSAKNEFFYKKDFVKYSIIVIPDMYPSIKCAAIKDSTKSTVYYYKGLINDDYGFNKLTFNYKTSSGDSLKSVNIPVNVGITSQEYYYAYDFSDLKVEKGEKIEYYFEVWDNDQVNGSKSAKTRIFEYYIPTDEEINNFENQKSKDIENKIAESKRLIDKIEKEVNDLQRDMINKKLSSWEKSKRMEQMNNDQKQLEKLLKEISKDNSQKNEMTNSFSEKNEELMKKQEKIQDLLENVMDEELKKLMQELEELMQEYNKDKINKFSERMKMNYEDLEEQLDRNLEILKRYEVENKVNKTIDKLKELSEKQNELSEKTQEKSDSNSELEKEQKKQSDEFDKAMEEYKKAMEKNKELEDPMNLDDFSEQQKQIEQEFDQGEESLEKNKSGKASKSQKQNSKNLKKMQNSMQSMMQQNMSSQSTENIDDMRQIIENLVMFSFDQEELMQELKGFNRKNPKYPLIVSKQKDIKDNFTVIEDSLNALAKRTPFLGNTINKDISKIKNDLLKVLGNMEESRRTSVKNVRSRQQYIMTSANNLALILSEILQQMQKQSNSMCKSGGGKCSKPGQGKPKMGKMKSQQKSLKQQMESMIQDLKKAGSKPNKNAMNKRLAKMLAQQEIFQSQLNKLMNSGGLSPKQMKLIQEIKRMSEVNTNDIINKQITPQTLKRQERILTRLLEAENSDYEREIDKKRKSVEAKNKKIGNPKEFFEYKRLKSAYNELLKSSDIKLFKFYNEKYKKYLININGE